MTIDTTEALVALHTRTDLYITRSEPEYASRILLYTKESESLLDRQCNGTIFEKETGRVLCHSQTKFTTVEESFEVLPGDTLNYTDDGTTIRLYHYNGTWYTATTKCMNAKYSKFSSKFSFDKLFWDVFPQDALGELDKMYTYIFILRHMSNRIVLKYSKNSLVFIEKVSNLDGQEVFEDEFVTSLSSVFNETPFNGLMDEFKRGVIIKRDGHTYMYDFTEYTEVASVRGNDKDIIYRYITLLVKDSVDAMALVRNYPEFSKDFARVNIVLFGVIQDVFKKFKSGKTLHRKHMYSKMLKRLDSSDTFSSAVKKFYESSPGYLFALMKNVKH